MALLNYEELDKKMWKIEIASYRKKMTDHADRQRLESEEEEEVS